MHKQDISVVIGSFNRKKYLKLTIKTVRQELIDSGLSFEIIIVDGGSTDGTFEWLLKQKDIITIVQHNRGKWKGRPIVRRSWGYFMNLGFKVAQGKYICMLSDDCLVIQGAIVNGYNHAEKTIKEGRKIGGVAFYWRNWPEQKKYWVGLTLGNKMFVNHGLYLKQALESVKYIDEESYTFYHADGDLGLKMWHKGYECIDSPNSYIEHFSDANTILRQSNNITQPKDWETYLNKWDGILYDKKSKQFGGWIEKKVEDTNKTAKLFNTPIFKFQQFIKIIATLRQILK